MVGPKGEASHRGPPPKYATDFHGAPLGKNFFNFSFQNGTFSVLYKFVADGGDPQTSRGPG